MQEEFSKEEIKAKLKSENQVSKIIAAISPDHYIDKSNPEDIREVKSLLKQGDFWQAVGKTKPVAVEEHVLIYDSTSETLEPLYFWILDFMRNFFPKDGDIKKYMDNFSSSPGSGHFSELGMKATKMQEEGMKMLGAINTVLKSIINLIYDLKEFEIRISHYKYANSKDKDEAESGMLALKQIWMDNVDVKRGRGSINMMAQDLNFVTLRDAFMIAGSESEVDKMDLNDRVKRILKPRLREFFEWKKRSETELQKRFEIEKTYLKSQVSSLELYTRWAKPYLISAERLAMKERGSDPAMVNVFNTIVLQLTLFGMKKINISETAIEDRDSFPIEFARRKFKRDYYYCVLIDFLFRGIPQRVSAQQAHYAFGGRVEVTFKGYCLNQEELDLLDAKMKEADIELALKSVDGITTDSLKQLKEDIDYFLKPEEERKKEEEKKQKSGDINPFSALFGFSKKDPKKKVDELKNKLEMLKKNGIKKDDYAENLVRIWGENKAASTCFGIFDVYKKGHGCHRTLARLSEAFKETLERHQLTADKA